MSGITGHDGGGAWVEIITPQDWGSGQQSLWACLTGSSPSSGTVAIAIGGYWWNIAAYFLELSNVDASGSVANALGTYDWDGGYDNRTLDTAVAAFASADSMGLAMYAGIGAVASATWEADWTEETAHETYMWIEPGYRINDNALDITVPSFGNNGQFLIEVKHAAADGPIEQVLRRRFTATDTDQYPGAW